MKKFTFLQQFSAALILMVISICGRANDLYVPGGYPTIQDAINASSSGDIIHVAPGTYIIPGTINVNQSVTIDGGSALTTKLQTSGNPFLFIVSTSSVTIKNLEIEKTDHADQNIIQVLGNNFELANMNMHGLFVIGSSETSRALEVTGNLIGLNIHHNQFTSLRQPAYINNNVSGLIDYNYTAGTKGWVIVSDANLTFTGNSWGTGANANVFDIVFINQGGSVNNYTDLTSISQANNNATVENQHSSYGSPVLANVYVQDGAVGGNGTAASPYPTIGLAIPRVSPGGRIYVAPGNYNENLTINKILTLAGNNYGVSCSAGRLSESIISGTGGSNSATISITASGVTVDGFTIKNHNGSFGISSNSNSNINISHNIITDVGNNTSGLGSSYGVYVEVGSSVSSNNVSISSNCINNIRGGENTALSSLTSPTAKSNNGSGGGILVGSSTAGVNVTNLSISSNIIDHITACTKIFTEGGKGAYGVQINVGASTSGIGKAISPIVSSNEINTLEGLWSHGIGLEGETPGASIANNSIHDLVDYKSPTDPDAVAVRVEDNVGAGSVSINFNSFTNVLLGISNVTAFEVSATCNWYGTLNPSTKVTGPVDYVPYLTNGTDNSLATTGFQPVPNSCNGYQYVDCSNKKEKKVIVCHNGKSTCIALSALSSHLAHGDILGPCNNNRGEDFITDLSEEFSLTAAPNPALSSTTIRYELPVDCQVNITLFDPMGRTVAVLVQGSKAAGSYNYELNTGKLSAGIYYYKMTAVSKNEKYTQGQKLVIIK